MFKKPFSFEGRIRRLEYCLSLIISFLIVAMVSSFLGPQGAESGSGMAGVVVLLPIIWLFFAQRAKRCHDRGVPAIWQFIPFYGAILLFGDSDPGENEYGPNPKGVEAVADDWDPIANSSKDVINEDGSIE